MDDVVDTLNEHLELLEAADGFIMVGLSPCGDTFVLSSDSEREAATQMVSSFMRWAKDEGYLHDA